MTSVSDHPYGISQLESVRRAAHKLGEHPQDHGWRDVYRLICSGLKKPSSFFEELVLESMEVRRDSSATHLVTLLGISLKIVAVELLDDLRAATAPEACLGALEAVLVEHGERIREILCSRRNSFTGARRFLVPQVLLSAYFAAGGPVDFADLGTGLGVLPRQLNAPRLFENFKSGLSWEGGTPSYRSIPLRSRFGVDHGPLPRIEWVRACYGESSYYDSLYRELLDTLDDADVQASEVHYRELDLLDSAALREFLRSNEVNAVNLSYALYELSSANRAEVIETVLAALRPPGVAIVTEPHAELTRPGCTVTLYDQRSAGPRSVLRISDGHFTGVAEPMADYGWFTARYPIARKSSGR